MDIACSFLSAVLGIVDKRNNGVIDLWAPSKSIEAQSAADVQL